MNTCSKFQYQIAWECMLCDTQKDYLLLHMFIDKQ